MPFREPTEHFMQHQTKQRKEKYEQPIRLAVLSRRRSDGPIHDDHGLLLLTFHALVGSRFHASRTCRAEVGRRWITFPPTPTGFHISAQWLRRSAVLRRYPGIPQRRETI